VCVFKSLQQFLKTELLGKVVDLNLVTALEHVAELEHVCEKVTALGLR